MVAMARRRLMSRALIFVGIVPPDFAAFSYRLSGVYGGSDGP
jgi:hypothetical protein